MHRMSGQLLGGGSTLLFRRLTIAMPYQLVTRFFVRTLQSRIAYHANAICVCMNTNHKQTAIITGASSGIGLGLTQGFLGAGFNVVANSRHVTTAGTLTPTDDLLLVDGDVGDP